MLNKEKEKENIKIVKEFDSPLYTLSLRSDGIAVLNVKIKNTVQLEDIKEMVDCIKLINEGKKVPLLILIQEHTVPSVEVRNFLAAPEGNPYSLASAYVLHSLPQRLIGQIYLNIQKPARPTKMFANQQEAIEWLKHYLIE